MGARRDGYVSKSRRLGFAAVVARQMSPRLRGERDSWGSGGSVRLDTSGGTRLQELRDAGGGTSNPRHADYDR